jgi:crotonobetainyl-CoA:carnitine CoA-transferase CaiB-like acyl-CoA transferase
MGVPEFAGKGKWGTIEQREAARAEVDEYVGAWTGKHTRDEVIDACESHQVPCGGVYAIDEIFEDPQYAARENIKFFNDARVGEYAMPNVVPRMTDTPGRIDRLGPALGEHNDEVWGGRMGLSKARMEELESRGVI